MLWSPIVRSARAVSGRRLSSCDAHNQFFCKKEAQVWELISCWAANVSRSCFTLGRRNHTFKIEIHSCGIKRNTVHKTGCWQTLSHVRQKLYKVCREKNKITLHIYFSPAGGAKTVQIQYNGSSLTTPVTVKHTKSQFLKHNYNIRPCSELRGAAFGTHIPCADMQCDSRCSLTIVRIH